MSLTIAEKRKSSTGTRFVVSAKITFDTSYPTGGESLTPGQLGLKKFDKIQIDPASGYVFDFDYTNNKVKAYRNAPAGTAVFTNSGSTATFTNSGSTSSMSLSGLSGAVEGAGNLAVQSGTVLGVSGAANVVLPHSGQITTIAKGTIASTAAGTIAFTGTAAVMAEVSNETNLGTVVTRVFAQGI